MFGDFENNGLSEEISNLTFEENMLGMDDIAERGDPFIQWW